MINIIIILWVSLAMGINYGIVCDHSGIYYLSLVWVYKSTKAFKVEYNLYFFTVLEPTRNTISSPLSRLS